MREFHEMFRKITSSRHFDRAKAFAKPLEDFLGVNHFWYYRVLNDGRYTYFGTHIEWSSYCFENHLLEQFPILKDPEKQEEGVHLMKCTGDQKYSSVQKEAWKQFGINFNLNLTKKIDGGVEAFGFGTNTDDPRVDELLLNRLPLLHKFLKDFREKNQLLFHQVLDLQVNLTPYFNTFQDDGSLPYSTPLPSEAFCKQMGWLPIHVLSKRERDVLALLSSGFPASYVAKRLRLSIRTVENYTATIKSKLYCQTKSELIMKGAELKTIGYL